MELWGKNATGAYTYRGNWVNGRPAYYKEEKHNFYLASLKGLNGKWGLSDKPDAGYAYMRTVEKVDSPESSKSWKYFDGNKGNEFEELFEWPYGNITVVCK